MRAIEIAMVLLLTACDVDLFGNDTREIAGPYALRHSDEAARYFIRGGSRHESSDWAVDGSVLQIGWDQQHILVQREAFAGADTAWVVVDVGARTVSGPLSEAAARRLPGIAALRAIPAADAWALLKGK